MSGRHRASPDEIVEAARFDDRPRWRRMRAPLAATAGVLAAGALVYAVDPRVPGRYPVCPTQWLLGVDCPGCGALRGTHALLHGDIAAAIDFNALLPLMVVILVVVGAHWYRQAWLGSAPAVTHARLRLRNAALVAALAAVLAFGVVRNFVPYLSSMS